jgi:hypothetical protein
MGALRRAVTSKPRPELLQRRVWISKKSVSDNLKIINDHTPPWLATVAADKTAGRLACGRRD